MLKKFSKVSLMSLLLMAVMCVSAFAVGTDNATNGSEFSGLWEKASGILSGYVGKLAAVVIIASGIAAREKIGMIGMIVAIFIGISLGLVPSIIDSAYTLTI